MHPACAIGTFSAAFCSNRPSENASYKGQGMLISGPLPFRTGLMFLLKYFGNPLSFPLLGKGSHTGVVNQNSGFSVLAIENSSKSHNVMTSWWCTDDPTDPTLTSLYITCSFGSVETNQFKILVVNYMICIRTRTSHTLVDICRQSPLLKTLQAIYFWVSKWIRWCTKHGRH